MDKILPVTCGIFDTEYALKQHRNGSIAVTEPFVTTDSDGISHLGYIRHCFTDLRMINAVVKFFDQDTLVLDATNSCGALTLNDVLNGQYHEGVEIIGECSKN